MKSFLRFGPALLYAAFIFWLSSQSDPPVLGPLPLNALDILRKMFMKQRLRSESWKICAFAPTSIPLVKSWNKRIFGPN